MENNNNEIKYFLDGARMTGSRKEVHEYIAEQLHFPEYYGKNLDALFDVLSTSKMSVEMFGCAEMLNALQKYGCKLLLTLFDAADENPDFRFAIVENCL